MHSRRGSHEEHDQIGSNSSTPPGAHTPRPDLVDKRLPSILNSYFGQVRDSFRSRPQSTSCLSKPTLPSTSTSTSTKASTSTVKMEENMSQEKCGLPTAPALLSLQVSSSRRPSASLPVQLKSGGLTEGTSVSSSKQNTPTQTPPHTPRSRSHGEPASRTATPPSKSGGNANGTTIGPVLGKLSVAISEGRGLRSSVDPYVVCQFQCAEYISEGPTNGEVVDDGYAIPKAAGSGVPISRTDSDRGIKPQAIPMRSRQSSRVGRDISGSFTETTDPKWGHKAVFDVVGEHSEIDVSVYDRSNQEAFLGHVRFCPRLIDSDKPLDGWFPLEPREGEDGQNITGDIHLRINFMKTDKKHYGPEDFQILKLIGKGTFGQVFQVRKKDSGRIYAMKVLSKKVIVQKKEVAHTVGERNILVRTAMTDSAFIVGLKFSFQTPTDLYLVTDYMSGGELFWHLQKEGRFKEDRAKFYIAELIHALQHLHEHDIVYRDLKPENILLDANGHIALCDFGLSKANLTDTDTTNTFCGTTEYLAPEVLLDEAGYTKMVDFWSLGVLVFEMCCGWSPFYAEDTQQMYKNIAFGKVRFPRDALSTEGRNFVKGLLNRNPKHRLGSQGDAEELKAHPFFADIDWDALGKKNLVPPFKPKLKSELDVSNFDPEFTNALNNGAGSLNARAAALASGVNPASTPLSPGIQAKFAGFTYVNESTMDRQFGDRDDDGMDRMEEDDNEDPDWEKVYSNEKGDRMSGVVSNSTDADDGIFNHGGFDV
ncbi:kinase-like protein [Tothia fuscella]|uniref:non-specific serine/threonine protein kinase n=1 Tax=Tothia fuscella TaxID=1048955 RepID=A0A9P4U0F9_9PEZI|nr:kinase-like protein [Tothia fuscella]